MTFSLAAFLADLARPGYTTAGIPMQAPKFHAGEIDISAGLAARLIAEQFPHWARLPAAAPAAGKPRRNLDARSAGPAGAVFAGSRPGTHRRGTAHGAVPGLMGRAALARRRHSRRRSPGRACPARGRP